jgi:recombinational DNA repair ATPase RecF
MAHSTITPQSTIASDYQRRLRSLSATLAQLDRRADALRCWTRQLTSSAERLVDPAELPSSAARVRQVAELRRALDELDAGVADLSWSVLALQSDLARAHS